MDKRDVLKKLGWSDELIDAFISGGYDAGVLPSVDADWTDEGLPTIGSSDAEVLDPVTTGSGTDIQWRL